MAEVGRWKVHREVLPTGLRSPSVAAGLFYICFLGRGPGLSARWVARIGGTEGRLLVVDGWEKWGRPVAWPDRASSVSYPPEGLSGSTNPGTVLHPSIRRALPLRVLGNPPRLAPSPIPGYEDPTER